MPDLQTPHYLIDLARLRVNMERIQTLRQQSGAKCLLALKCFATWSVFDLMQQYMDGTTSSSLYELKLGRQKFAGETHAYSVAWADDEIEEMVANCDKIIFNSIGQLERFAEATEGTIRGLRVNPQVSSSDYLLADPARPFSRLGEHDPAKIEAMITRLAATTRPTTAPGEDAGVSARTHARVLVVPVRAGVSAPTARAVSRVR